MYAIRLPSGEFLDIAQGQSISLELNNLVFSSSDSSVLPGSYSFPFDLPLTGRLRRQLGFPDLITLATRVQPIEDVWLYVQNTALFFGTLRVTEASPTSVKCHLLINPVRSLKEKMLGQFDLGGTRAFNSTQQLLAHAKDTASQPLNHDYIFFPVYNPGYLTSETSAKQRWLNFYDGDTQQFEPAADAPGFMPFVRVQYLLERIFADTPYEFRNEWQVAPDLQNIVLYNHRSLYNSGQLELQIDLANHLPKISGTALLRHFMGLFCLGLIYNPFMRTLRLVPLKKILSSAPAFDWTSKQADSHVISYDDDTTPVTLGYQDPDDRIQAYFQRLNEEPTQAEVVATVASLPDLDATTIPGIYYVRSESSYWRRIIGLGGPRVLHWGGKLDKAPVESGSPEFVATMQPLYDAPVPFIWGQAAADAWSFRAPVIDQPGTITYIVGSDTVEQRNNNPLRFTVYRGFRTGGPYAGYQSRSMPYAAATPYNNIGIPVGSLSVRWEGAYGLYEQWWKGWHQMLRDGKTVTMRFRLTLTDLVNFEFDKKVRVNNMDYIVKKLRVSINQSGMLPAEAELVSII